MSIVVIFRLIFRDILARLKKPEFQMESPIAVLKKIVSKHNFECSITKFVQNGNFDIL